MKWCLSSRYASTGGKLPPSHHSRIHHRNEWTSASVWKSERTIESLQTKKSEGCSKEEVLSVVGPGSVAGSYHRMLVNRGFFDFLSKKSVVHLSYLSNFFIIYGKTHQIQFRGLEDPREKYQWRFMKIISTFQVAHFHEYLPTLPRFPPYYQWYRSFTSLKC